MRVGATVPYRDEDLTFVRQMGVIDVDTTPSSGLGIEDGGYWRADALMRVREHVESMGLRLAAMHLPLTSAGIEHQVWPGIMRATADRDRDIERVVRCIEAAASAGIDTLLYNLAILPVVRSPQRSPGRGGLAYSHFDYATMAGDPPHPDAPVTADMAWDRITYFVERVLPVATACRVRLGCHPHDPAMPVGVGFRGIARVLGHIEGLKRFVDLSPSPYHGLNFCQGTVAEMCTDAEQVYEAISHFASLGRIFWVHMRNIRGGFLRFDEVMPDEGDVDMWRAVQTFHAAGYDGVLDPDHVPASPQDTPWGHRARAYGFGYLRGLLQALETTVKRAEGD